MLVMTLDASIALQHEVAQRCLGGSSSTRPWSHGDNVDRVLINHILAQKRGTLCQSCPW